MPPFFRRFALFPASVFRVDEWLRFTKLDLLLPFYHVVSNEYLPHIAPLYTYKNEKGFIADLDLLLKYMRPVSLQELYEKRRNNEKFPTPYFHLTFDDGLREVGEIVAPILLKKGIPATFFVNSSFVGNNSLFFRYKAALLVDKIKASDTLPEFPFDKNIRSESDWRHWILSARYDNDKELDQLAQLLGISYADFLQEKRPYLEINELKDLKQRGFDIGAHSQDHPEYRFIYPELQILQTANSLDWISQNGLESIPCFAFPFTDFGVSTSTIKKIKSLEHSPRLLFGTAGIKLENDPFHLQRLAVEGSPIGLERMLCSELLLFQLKKCLGKHIVDRHQ